MVTCRDSVEIPFKQVRQSLIPAYCNGTCRPAICTVKLAALQASHAAFIMCCLVRVDCDSQLASLQLCTDNNLARHADDKHMAQYENLPSSGHH